MTHINKLLLLALTLYFIHVKSLTCSETKTLCTDLYNNWRSVGKPGTSAISCSICESTYCACLAAARCAKHKGVNPEFEQTARNNVYAVKIFGKCEIIPEHTECYGCDILRDEGLHGPPSIYFFKKEANICGATPVSTEGAKSSTKQCPKERKEMIKSFLAISKYTKVQRPRLLRLTDLHKLLEAASTSYKSYGKTIVEKDERSLFNLATNGLYDGIQRALELTNAGMKLFGNDTAGSETTDEAVQILRDAGFR